jgi:predicted RNA-binding protein (virulence factor B family)
MKPKMKPNVKATLQELEVGDEVRFTLYDASESTIRSTATRVAKVNGGKYTVWRSQGGISIYVTRIA